jgi:galactose mutarotase-like enzyme
VIGERLIDGFQGLTLVGQEPESLEVTFVPGAGMVACSLRHRGEELLGQRGGLAHYVREHSTMGIPLLYPWANRVGGKRFTTADREVDLTSPDLPLSFDDGGLPIHGLLAGADGWSVESHRSTDAGGVLEAGFDFGADTRLLRAFPFPHRLSLRATLSGATLTIVTTVHADQGVTVPVAFGFHPYLTLPDVERGDWRVEVPVTEHLDVDDQMLPTGARTATTIASGPLGSRTFDDGFLAPTHGEPFVLTGGGRRIELRIGEGYPFAQVFAPADDDVVAYEPMTAPTDALVAGGRDLPLVEPGESYSASFSVTVAATG